ncbi:MAG: DUF4339 domain-containing protein [Planctomycetota bacterium]|nr:MAG: DUF4339 domain-containing protein [Planctomycetota bacterium]
MEFLVWILFGLVTAFLAASRGRNVLAWFLLGLLGGCFALILVLALPDLNEERRVREEEEAERRRLRELLQQERLKNQAFRSHATARLDRHDQALGLDTRSAAPDPALTPPAPPPAMAQGIPARGWYLARPGGQPEGPFDLDGVQLFLAGADRIEDLLVWHETLGDWTRFQESPLRVLR